MQKIAAWYVRGTHQEGHSKDFAKTMSKVKYYVKIGTDQAKNTARRKYKPTLQIEGGKAENGNNSIDR